MVDDRWSAIRGGGTGPEGHAPPVLGVASEGHIASVEVVAPRFGAGLAAGAAVEWDEFRRHDLDRRAALPVLFEGAIGQAPGHEDEPAPGQVLLGERGALLPADDGVPVGLRLATGTSLPVKRFTGSLPRRPISSTRLNDCAMIVLLSMSGSYESPACSPCWAALDTRPHRRSAGHGTGRRASRPRQLSEVARLAGQPSSDRRGAGSATTVVSSRASTPAGMRSPARWQRSAHSRPRVKRW